jgi:predicted transcriptional regulator
VDPGEADGVVIAWTTGEEEVGAETTVTVVVLEAIEVVIVVVPRAPEELS